MRKHLQLVLRVSGNVGQVQPGVHLLLPCNPTVDSCSQLRLPLIDSKQALPEPLCELNASGQTLNALEINHRESAELAHTSLTTAALITHYFCYGTNNAIMQSS